MELPPALLPNPTYPFFHGYVKLHCWGSPKIEAYSQMRGVYKISPGSQPPTNKPGGLGKLKPMCHSQV